MQHATRVFPIFLEVLEQKMWNHLLAKLINLGQDCQLLKLIIDLDENFRN